MSAIELVQPKLNIKQIKFVNFEYLEDNLDQYDDICKKQIKRYIKQNRFDLTPNVMSLDNLMSYTSIKTLYTDYLDELDLLKTYKNNNFIESVRKLIPNTLDNLDSNRLNNSLNNLHNLTYGKLILGRNTPEINFAPADLDNLINSNINNLKQANHYSYLHNNFALKVLFPKYRNSNLEINKNKFFKILRPTIIKSKEFFTNHPFVDGDGRECIQILGISNLFFKDELEKSGIKDNEFISLLKQDCISKNNQANTNLIFRFYIKLFESNNILFSNNGINFNNITNYYPSINESKLPIERNFV